MVSPQIRRQADFRASGLIFRESLFSEMRIESWCVQVNNRIHR